MIILYTLPSCPICNMVKTKLNQKNIQFVEKDFDELPIEVNTDRAPVLFNGEYLLSPTDINNWIKEV